MTRVQLKDLHEHIDQEITIKGWVNIRRDHGKLIFMDLRDETGMVQMVALPNHEEAHALANTVRPEWILEVRGKVNKRPERMINSDQPNGDVEIEILAISVLSEAETPAFEVNEDTAKIDEEVRLKYRYLDLRTERMQKNLRLRSSWVNSCREFLLKDGFTEIETPNLAAATAEGSRDFVVPSRLNPGKFYALPQSPQQYKQLLMASGFEKYFQMARAFRDEDLRADRGFEHTQVDIEVAFKTEEELLTTFEAMIIHAAESNGFVIKEKPFPRITYKEAMEQYGADKFDLRTDEEKERGVLAYAWVVDFPFYEKTDDGKWTFTHNPFSMPKEEDLEKHLKGENLGEIKAQQYDLVCNGFEVGGGSVRAHKAEILEATYKNMGYSDEETKASIGHMLEAFKYGAPPHGGIALGVERNLMTMTGEEALREVQAFPTTSSGRTAVMDGPGELSGEQLRELGIEVKKK